MSVCVENDSEMDYASVKDTYACPCDESKMYDKFLMPVKSKGIWVWFDGQEEPYLDLVLNYSSAAVSDAIRLCRHTTGKKYMISFDGSFHGVSRIAASVADDRLVASRIMWES